MLTDSFFASNKVILAPMAGVTDRPFRSLCRGLGADLAVSEMVSSDPRLRGSVKTLRRIDHVGEPLPRSVQIAGADPDWLADAARFNIDRGADIIDINMGCPAKKVCNVAAGSALLSDEALVARILEKVVASIDAPVTLKIRTGPDPGTRNALRIAHIAQESGIRALAIHGRTRQCAFRGEAEYETIRKVKAQARIPIIANGDITSPEQAQRVLRFTGADAVMIGRAAQGDPWLPGRIARFLHDGTLLPLPSLQERADVLIQHLRALHDFHGERTGAKIARKHLSWHCRAYAGGEEFWRRINHVECPQRQIALTRDFFRQKMDESQSDSMAAA